MYQILSSYHLDGYLESCIGGRSENQDACGFSDTPVGALIVVCDGMGGMNGGSVASSTAVKTIVTLISNATGQEDPISLIRSAVTAANKAILEAGNSDPNLAGMGTTLVLALINKDCAYLTSIGDSRIYQIRSQKKVFRTEDDSIVFQLVKSKALTEEEARTSSSSNIITKALGISEDLEFDVISLPYDKKDRFLLCTDGFWGSMPETELLQLIYKKGDLSKNIEYAFSVVEENGKKNNPDHFDNYTAAVFDVGEYSKKRSVMEKKLKILSLVLFILLLLSLAFSYCLYRSSRPVQDEQTQESALSDRPDSVAVSMMSSSEDASMKTEDLSDKREQK